MAAAVPTSARYDCIVIGGGHNGLVCASYLAKSGRSVLVLEAAEQVGGAAVTREFAPGYRVSSCAHLLHLMPQSLIAELDLGAHGFKLANNALSTTALSPAGGWHHGGPETKRLARLFRQNYRMLKLLGPGGAQLMRRPRFRALALRDVAMRPAQVPPALAVEMAEASAGCAIYLALLEELTLTGFGELPPIASPVQIAWGTNDRILPWPGYAERFRQMTPEAEWVELRGLGHCPMLDDAPLTASAILELTRRVDGDRATAAPDALAAPAG